LLCSHVYLTVKRKIKNNEQVYEEKEELIQLFTDQIKTASDLFLIEDVLDISYRSFSNEKGLLYLHTTRGVFSFITIHQPIKLITIYKELKKQR
jgi:transposase-like protein